VRARRAEAINERSGRSGEERRRIGVGRDEEPSGRFASESGSGGAGE
jgi:hypothetical protein